MFEGSQYCQTCYPLVIELLIKNSRVNRSLIPAYILSSLQIIRQISRVNGSPLSHGCIVVDLLSLSNISVSTQTFQVSLNSRNTDSIFELGRTYSALVGF